MQTTESRKKRVHITIDCDLMDEIQEYRKRATGRPGLSGVIETALENLLESEILPEKTS